ncbi:MAG: DUF58 domain-containing protein [Kiritimatiellaeota bacterium]|nr:DUF58 domain-containing protein [Kiritimatiellota bacterium]
MIYPGKITVWILALAPFAAMAPHGSLFLNVFLLVCAIFVIAAVYDARGAMNIIKGVSVSLPESERMTIYRESKLKFSFANSADDAAHARIKPEFPAELDISAPEMLIDLPGGSETAAEWKCTPTKRGDLEIERVHVEVSSGLGLWLARKTFAVESVIKVYPNLLKDRTKLSSFFLNRGDSGLHLLRMLGRGREFEKLREYIPGDSMDIISWKTTAKKNKPISKVFQQERTQDVYVVIDISRLSGREAGGVSVLEHFISAALILALVTEKQKDSFGLIAFDDNVRAYVKAKGGKNHFGACREAVYALQPTPASPDFNNLFSFIRTNVRKRALLVFLTDIDDPALSESFISDAPLVNRKHVCVVNSMKTGNHNTLFQRDDAPSTSIDILDRLTGHVRWSEFMEVANALRKMGMKLTASEFETFTSDIVSEYLNIKRRQII